MPRILAALALFCCYRVPAAASQIATSAAPPIQLGGQTASNATAIADDLRRRIEAAPNLAFQQVDMPINMPAGQTLGMVS